MDKIWLVVNTNVCNYDCTEVNTVACKTREEALEKFNEFSLYYLSTVKEICSGKYSVSESLSFSEYEKIASDNGDSICVACFLDNEDDKMLSVENEFRTHLGYDAESFIVHMYPCVFGERDFSILSPGRNKENRIQEIEDFYKSLTK